LGAAVKIGYLAQAHADLNLDQTVLDEVLSVPAKGSKGESLLVGQARNYLGRFLFSGDDVFKPVNALSGGERARVALAKLAMSGANFLVLDEPTNHLDIPSQEILQTVLGDFPGTILLVTHDRYFIDVLATQVWALADGTLFVSKGDSSTSAYSAYLADQQARRMESSDQPTFGSNDRAAARESNPEAIRKREQARRQRALTELESAIEATEVRLAELAAGLEEASHTQAIEQLQTLSRDYQATAEDLARLLDEWAAMEAA
jgi:ATP-binding cassette subfamily F protein 3